MRPTHILGFFSDRWHAKVALHQLFWLDMLAVGTVINLFASFAALMVVALIKEEPWALVLHFLPLPYNAFLLAAIWRFPVATLAWRLGASAWFVVMTVA